MSKIVDFKEAASQIKSGSTVAVVGVIGWIVPEKLLKAIGDRFEQTGAPRDLTLFVPCFAGDNGDIKGIDHIIREGMTKRLITGSFINPPDPKTGERPRSMQLVQADKIEAHTFHIGVMMHWLREIARGGIVRPETSAADARKQRREYERQLEARIQGDIA